MEAEEWPAGGEYGGGWVVHGEDPLSMSFEGVWLGEICSSAIVPLCSNGNWNEYDVRANEAGKGDSPDGILRFARAC